MNKIKALILDMDGVIWRNKEPIGNLPEIFSRIKDLNLKFVFATNNSMNSVKKYVDLLNRNGITTTGDQIFTSATATGQYLHEQHPNGGNVFIIGMNGLEIIMKQYGFINNPDDALAVVVGMDRSLNYEKLRIATLLIRSGVPFIGTNPDRTFPTPEGLIPGAGSLLAALEAATNVSPNIIGKPKATMFLQALEYLEEKPENVLVIGDRLETDIAGGQAANCKCALVLSGVSTQEMGDSWSTKLDYIAENLQTLVNNL